MNRQVVVEPAAVGDIDEQSWYFLEHEGDIALALRFEEAVRQTFDLLSEQSGIGAIRVLGSPNLTGLRMRPVLHFKNSLIFYISDDTTLRIVRILHGARNIRAILESK